MAKMYNKSTLFNTIHHKTKRLLSQTFSAITKKTGGFFRLSLYCQFLRPLLFCLYRTFPFRWETRFAFRNSRCPYDAAKYNPIRIHSQLCRINSPISSIQSSHCGYTPVLSKYACPIPLYRTILTATPASCSFTP